MIQQQVTAGFLDASAKTHFQAGSGQEAGEGREMQATADRRFKARLSPPTGGAQKSLRFLCPLPHYIQSKNRLGEGTTSLFPHALLHAKKGW